MKLVYTTLFIFLGLISCKNKKKTAITNHNTTFYVGTYTNRIKDSNSQGIYQYQLHQNGTLDSISLAAKTDNPSFLTKSVDGKYVIATNSHNNGSITSFEIENDKLKEINQSATGDNPCYVTAGKNNYVLTANYNDGTYNLHQFDENGVLSKSLDTKKSSFTTPSIHPRQDAPHAHSCYFEPNSNNIITIDLGTNKLLFNTIDTEFNKIVANQFSELEMPKEAGPRILTFHPTKPWIYVINELNSKVTFIKKNTTENTYKVVETVETLSEADKEGNSAAHIAISKDGNYIYVSNRGHDSLEVLKISDSGNLKLIQSISTHGKHPRHFALSPDNQFLLVANRDTDNICTFKRNSKTGKLTFVNKINAPKPVCILF